jgi:hypothetical protein
MGQSNRLSTFPRIPNPHNTIGTTTTNQICQLVVVAKVSNRGGGIEGKFGFVGAVDIPHIGAGFHFVRGLLESVDGIGSSDFGRSIHVP